MHRSDTCTLSIFDKFVVIFTLFCIVLYNHFTPLKYIFEARVTLVQHLSSKILIKFKCHEFNMHFFYVHCRNKNKCYSSSQDLKRLFSIYAHHYENGKCIINAYSILFISSAVSS